MQLAVAEQHLNDLLFSGFVLKNIEQLQGSAQQVVLSQCASVLHQHTVKTDAGKDLFHTQSDMLSFTSAKCHQKVTA